MAAAVPRPVVKGLYAQTLRNKKSSDDSDDDSGAGGSSGTTGDEVTAKSSADNATSTATSSTDASYDPTAPQTYTARGVMAKKPSVAGGFFETTV